MIITSSLTFEQIRSLLDFIMLFGRLNIISMQKARATYISMYYYTKIYHHI